MYKTVALKSLKEMAENKNQKKTKIMKKYIIFSLLFIQYVVGQELPKIAPPSPEAASVFKFSEIPVSFYTGLPNIDIPLFEIESGGVTIPISISYHARGIQVAEIASRVGLGWSLNCGGMIYKQVRGLKDEDYFPCEGLNLFSNLQAREFLNDPNMLPFCDLIPDQYSYKLNGMSGKFIHNTYDYNNWISQNYNNIKVLSNSRLTDGNGNDYILNKEVGLHYQLHLHVS